MDIVKKLCLSFMQGRMNNKEFFSFLISHMIQHVDDIQFVSKIAQQLYYIEPEAGDGE